MQWLHPDEHGCAVCGSADSSVAPHPAHGGIPHAAILRRLFCTQQGSNSASFPALPGDQCTVSSGRKTVESPCNLRH